VLCVCVVFILFIFLLVFVYVCVSLRLARRRVIYSTRAAFYGCIPYGLLVLTVAGAVVAGEAILSEILEAGAVRGAAVAGEEALAAAEGAAVVEGAAVLRNGQVVMHEMEKQIFGKAMTGL
jgi:hypothetical protein